MLCCETGKPSQQTVNVLVHISQSPEDSRDGSPKDICSQKTWNKWGAAYVEICCAQGKAEAMYQTTTPYTKAAQQSSMATLRVRSAGRVVETQNMGKTFTLAE